MNRLNNPALFRQSCYINGQWVDSSKTISVLNPVDQSVLGTVPSLSPEQVNDAIVKAHHAMEAWRQFTAKQRADRKSVV